MKIFALLDACSQVSFINDLLESFYSDYVETNIKTINGNCSMDFAVKQSSIVKAIIRFHIFMRKEEVSP